jgi:glycerophosphoryl diester phosphodiesterase
MQAPTADKIKPWEMAQASVMKGLMDDPFGDATPTQRKIREITEIIRELGHFEDTIFISFYMENLIDLRTIAPDAVAQFLTSNPITDEMLDTLKTYRLDMDAKYTLLTRELVDKMHALGMTVNCWTCDVKEDAEALRALGVDQITSNILE